MKDEMKMNEVISMLRWSRGTVPDARRAQEPHPRRNVWLMNSPIGLIGHGASGAPVDARLAPTRSP